MDNSRFSKFTHIADLVICSVWLLLVAHEGVNGRMINPFILLFPALRIWISFLMKRHGSPDGILCVRAGDTGGLRDRYGVILPVDKYNRIELLTPSKPYCKVRKNGKWQIYDIERQELVSDEWFEDVIPCDEYVYRLKTQNGDKYLSLRWYYNPDGEQTAMIVDELPVKDEE